MHRYALYLWAVLLTVVALSIAPANADADCIPHCATQLTEDDILCNFNDENFCGSPIGDIWFCTGPCDDAVCMSGGGYIVYGDDDLFSSEELLIEFQVRFTRLPQAGEHASGLVTKYRGHDAFQSEWGVFAEKNGTWLLCGDGSGCIASGPGMMETGVLYCVRALIDHGYGELWVNGELVASGEIAMNAANTSTPVVIGNSYQPGHNNPFYGMIDEVLISNSNCRATIAVKPEKLNGKSEGKWISCFIELPGLDVWTIDVPSLRLNGVAADTDHPSAVGDHDMDGIEDLMVKFSRSAVIAALEEGDAITVMVSGYANGSFFCGMDTVTVFNKPDDADDSSYDVAGLPLKARPNPFNPTTTIEYNVPKPGRVLVQIWDVCGRLVRTLEDTHRPTGKYSTVWNGTDSAGHSVAAGIYFCRIDIDGKQSSKKLVMIR